MAPILKTPNLTLRPAIPADADRRFEIGAEPDENLRLYGIQPETAPPFTREQAELWAQSLIDHPYAWVIEGTDLIGTARWIALISLTDAPRLLSAFGKPSISERE